MKQISEERKWTKLWRIILIFVPLLIWNNFASAKIYRSPLGFSIDLPPHWLVVTGEQIKGDQELLNFLNQQKWSKNLVEHIKREILKGEVEHYYNLKTSDEHFWDNIIVRKSIHQNLSKLVEECSSLPRILSNSAGRPIAVYECGLKKLGHFDLFYSELEGRIEGSTTIQYGIQKKANEVLVFGGTCKVQRLKIFREEFENIMASFRIL